MVGLRPLLVGFYTLCEDCDDIQIKDKVDHLNVFPLQELMSYQQFGKDDGHDKVGAVHPILFYKAFIKYAVLDSAEMQTYPAQLTSIKQIDCNEAVIDPI